MFSPSRLHAWRHRATQSRSSQKFSGLYFFLWVLCIIHNYTDTEHDGYTDRKKPVECVHRIAVAIKCILFTQMYILFKYAHTKMSPLKLIIFTHRTKMHLRNLNNKSN